MTLLHKAILWRDLAFIEDQFCSLRANLELLQLNLTFVNTCFADAFSLKKFVRKTFVLRKVGSLKSVVASTPGVASPGKFTSAFTFLEANFGSKSGEST